MGTAAQQHSIGQANRRTVGITARGELAQYFYLFMSLLIVAVFWALALFVTDVTALAL